MALRSSDFKKNVLKSSIRKAETLLEATSGRHGQRGQWEAVSFPQAPVLSAEHGDAVPKAGQTGSPLLLVFGCVAQVIATFCFESSGSAGPWLREEEVGFAGLRSQ